MDLPDLCPGRGEHYLYWTANRPAVCSRERHRLSSKAAHQTHAREKTPQSEHCHGLSSQDAGTRGALVENPGAPRPYVLRTQTTQPAAGALPLSLVPSLLRLGASSRRCCKQMLVGGREASWTRLGTATLRAERMEVRSPSPEAGVLLAAPHHPPPGPPGAPPSFAALPRTAGHSANGCAVPFLEDGNRLERSGPRGVHARSARARLVPLAASWRPPRHSGGQKGDCEARGSPGIQRTEETTVQCGSVKSGVGSPRPGAPGPTGAARREKMRSKEREAAKEETGRGGPGRP